MSTFETSKVSHDEMVAITEMWDAEWEATWVEVAALEAEMAKAEAIATRAELWAWFTADPAEEKWDD